MQECLPIRHSDGVRVTTILVINRIEKRLEHVLKAVQDLEHCEDGTISTIDSVQGMKMRNPNEGRDSISFENIDLLNDESSMGNPSEADDIPSGLIMIRCSTTACHKKKDSEVNF